MKPKIRKFPNFQPFISKAVLLIGLLALTTGLAIGIMNEDSFVWSLVRAAFMALIFGWCTRYLLRAFFKECMHASLDAAMEEMAQMQTELEETKKAAKASKQVSPLKKSLDAANAEQLANQAAAVDRPPDQGKVSR